MKKILYLVVCLVVLGGMAIPARAAYVRGDDDQNISEVITGDAFLGGNTVKVNKTVEGELFAAANNLTISEKGGRSLYLAASNVTVENGATYNAYVAGNNVTLKGEYGHDVYVVGNKITLDKGAVINGELHVAGGDVTLHGKIGGNVFTASQTLSSDAEIGGLLKADAETITFEGGSVAKDFDYVSKNKASGLDKVKIAGSTSRTEPESYQKTTGQSPIGIMVYAFFSSLILGLALLALTKRMSREVVLQTQKAWLQSFLYGVSALFAIPLIILLVAFTIIGIKLAFIIGLVYILLLFLAGVLGMLFVGSSMVEQLMPNFESSVWANLIVGVIAVTALRALPMVGGWFGFLYFVAIIIPVLGALIHWLGKQLS